MVKSVSYCCVRGSRLFSNPVTYMFDKAYICVNNYSSAHVYIICDCLSKNPPSSHFLVFREIPFKKIQLKITSLALVVETFTEHDKT